jgi:hypothetical protein
VTRPCLGGCGRLIRSGSYCRPCRPRNGSTRRWRKVRRQVLVRDRFTCWRCGRPATDVHHLTPVAEGGTDHPSGLVAACPACHREPSGPERPPGRIEEITMQTLDGAGRERMRRAIWLNYAQMGSG